MVLNHSWTELILRVYIHCGPKSQLDRFRMIFFAVPPSPPTLLGAVATGSTTIFLQWTPGTDDGGSPLTNYVIEYRLLNDESFISVVASVDDLSATISGLTPYGLYEVQVRGENAVGRGDPSSSLSTRTHSEGEHVD